MSQTTTERSLEQMAAELRHLAGQRVSARVLEQVDGGDDAGRGQAVALMGEVIRTEVRRAVERVADEHRQAVAGLVLDHSRGLKAQSERLDQLMSRVDHERDRLVEQAAEAAAIGLARAIVPRLDHVIALQEEMNANLSTARPGGRRSIALWLAGLVVAFVLGIVVAPATAPWLSGVIPGF